MDKEVLDMLAKTPMTYFHFRGRIVLLIQAASQFTVLFIQIFKQANVQEQTFSCRQLSFTGLQVGCKNQEKQTGHCMGYQDCHSNNGSRGPYSQFQFHNWIVDDWRSGVWMWVEGLVWKELEVLVQGDPPEWRDFYLLQGKWRVYQLQMLHKIQVNRNLLPVRAKGIL